ncbi:MAG: SpoIIE family protein phosphatase, partial [Bacteroidales bacterium]|nr:SpoIIE family protein phosphatase [Bacteroidales bacterium]
FLTNIKDFNGNSLTKTSYLKLKNNYNRVTVFLSAPGYLKKGFVSYFYGIDVSSNNEFITTRNPYFPITKLSPGKHVLSIYAVNSLNEKSETLKVIIHVTPPIWQTTWFIIAVFSIFLILVSLGLSAFFRKKQRKIKEYNEILELKVKERTSEIEKQNQLIQNQNLEIYEQYKKIDYQNKEITGSIRYAGKIQRAALSDTGIYSKYVSELFILYKPRDIVSGDFYWISESKNKLLIAAVDCTGHGVPGGFLSMLGISFLNEIVKEIGKTHEKILAADILNELRKKIITTLSTHGEEERKDGMDMSLAIIDKENMQLNFAGANNPSYILRDSKIAKIEADRMPVGSNKKLNDIPFKNKYLTLKTNDCIYLFSDGFADQFGGKFLKKFNSRRFREMLLHIHSHPMAKQEEMVDKILDKWKGNSEQIDDILLIGIKI